MVCYSALSPLVDKVLSTRLVSKTWAWGGPCLQEYDSSWGRGLVWAGAPPSPGLQIGWAGRSLLLCSRMKHLPLRSWCRCDSVFIQAKLPVKQITVAFALFVHQQILSGSVMQAMVPCEQLGNASHLVLKKQVGILWDSRRALKKKNCKKQRP